MTAGWLYVLHFDNKLSHAQHYLGSTQNPTERWTAHATGNGARITEVLHEKGEHWIVAAVYQTLPNIDHLAAERHAKRQKNTAIYCPICNPKKNVAPKNTIETPLHKPHSTELNSL
jgi:predicted GIY-YIG superfamily endonuclease